VSRGQEVPASRLRRPASGRPAACNREVVWLLEEDNPSIRYRTLTELLSVELSSSEDRGQKSAIYASKAVQAFFTRMGANGDWLVAGKRQTGTGTENIGPGFCISHLAELAVGRTYPPMNLAVTRFLSQLADSQFGRYPCGDALWLRAVILAGFRDHRVVRRAIDRMPGCIRWDGGCLCARAGFSDANKSCLHGSQNMLLAFAELPELWDSAQCRTLVDYFLERRVYFRRKDHTDTPRGDLRAIFPFNLRQGLLEPLYALSKMGFGNRCELAHAWALLESKRTADDRYILDWTPPRTYLKGGTGGKPSKWVTLYALLAKAYRDQDKMRQNNRVEVTR
jgi:hypothetical protein